jgi:hypothetical protein
MRCQLVDGRENEGVTTAARSEKTTLLAGCAQERTKRTNGEETLGTPETVDAAGGQQRVSKERQDEPSAPRINSTHVIWLGNPRVKAAK